MPTRVRVGLVIVTYNAAAHLDRCLAAVAAQARPPDRLVLVDNGSQDQTRAVAHATAARLSLPLELVASERNLGFAAANNRAVALLDDCEAIATLNPDAFPEPEWLAALVEAAAAHPDAASFASRLMMPGSPARVDGSGDVYHASGLAWRHAHGAPASEVQDLLEARPVFAACAAAALYRRDDWVRAGGFDERYFCYAEDVDLGFRLQLLGRTCRYVPDAVAVHLGSSSSGVDSAFAVYHGHRNLEWTFVKDMPGPLLVRHLASHIAASLASIAWHVARGRGGAIVHAKWDALRGLPAAWRERRRIQRARVVDAQAVAALLDRTPLLRRFRTRSKERRASARSASTQGPPA
jgi:GT2 family glycosyltransferase